MRGKQLYLLRYCRGGCSNFKSRDGGTNMQGQLTTRQRSSNITSGLRNRLKLSEKILGIVFHVSCFRYLFFFFFDLFPRH